MRSGSSDRPPLKAIYEVLVDICHRWKFIGIALDVEHTILKRIECEFPNRPQESLVEIVEEWLKSCDPTWKGLANALRSRTVQETQLADDIEAKYCQQITNEAGSQLQRSKSVFRDKLQRQI